MQSYMFTPNKLTHLHNHKTQEMRFDVIVVVKFVIRDSPEFQDMERKDIILLFQCVKKLLASKSIYVTCN